jgi:hypothetical protein
VLRPSRAALTGHIAHYIGPMNRGIAAARIARPILNAEGDGDQGGKE